MCAFAEAARRAKGNRNNQLTCRNKGKVKEKRIVVTRNRHDCRMWCGWMSEWVRPVQHLLLKKSISHSFFDNGVYRLTLSSGRRETFESNTRLFSLREWKKIPTIVQLFYVFVCNFFLFNLSLSLFLFVLSFTFFLFLSFIYGMLCLNA